jgi:hypothetical protein
MKIDVDQLKQNARKTRDLAVYIDWLVLLREQSPGDRAFLDQVHPEDFDAFIKDASAIQTLLSSMQEAVKAVQVTAREEKLVVKDAVLAVEV